MNANRMVEIIKQYQNVSYNLKYEISDHPAKQLDDYMKEQYMLLLL